MTMNAEEVEETSRRKKTKTTTNRSLVRNHEHNKNNNISCVHYYAMHAYICVAYVYVI